MIFTQSLHRKFRWKSPFPSIYKWLLFGVPGRRVRFPPYFLGAKDGCQGPENMSLGDMEGKSQRFSRHWLDGSEYPANP